MCKYFVLKVSSKVCVRFPLVRVRSIQPYSKWITNTHEGLLKRLIQHEVKSSAVSAARPNPTSALTSIQHSNHALTDLEHTLVNDCRFHGLKVTQSVLAAILV